MLQQVVVAGGFCLCGTLGGSRLALFYQLLYLAHRVAEGLYLLEEVDLLHGVVQCEQGAGMTHVELAVLEGHLYLCGKLEETQVIGYGGAFLAYTLAQAVLGEVVLFEQVLVGKGYLHGVEVFALYVLDEGHLHDVLVIGGAYVGGYGGEPGEL